MVNLFDKLKTISNQLLGSHFLPPLLFLTACSSEWLQIIRCKKVEMQFKFGNECCISFYTSTYMLQIFPFQEILHYHMMMTQHITNRNQTVFNLEQSIQYSIIKTKYCVQLIKILVILSVSKCSFLRKFC